MNAFVIIAAALALAASVFVAFPLLRRQGNPGFAAAGVEQKLAVYRHQLAELSEDKVAGRLGDDQYEQARGELEDRLIEEMPDADAPPPPAQRSHRAAAISAGIAVPLLAAALYLVLGDPAAINPQRTDAAHGLGQLQVEAMITRLATRLESNPQDAKGWVMLARAQAVLGRFEEASKAYAKSVALFPDDAQLLADYADALALAHGGRLAGEPEKLVERALIADPNNAKALSLAGTIAYDKRDFALAARQWERLRSVLPANSEFAESVQRSIDQVKALAQREAARQKADSAAVSGVSARK